MCFNGQITETAGTLAATTALVGLTDPQKTVSGDADGNIWIWNGADRGALLGKHDGPVTSLTAFKAEKEGVVGPSGVISGSKDSIKVWNLDEMSIIQEFSISSLIVQVGRSMFYKSGESIDMSVCGKNSPGYVTAISADATLQRLLITLSSSLVIEVATNSGAASIISEGCGSQITAMCPHTGEANTILTASADGMIRCWNVSDSGAKVPGVLGALPSVNTATALQFIKADCFAVGTTESADPKSPGVVMIVEISPTYEMTVVHQLSNVGKGKITFIKMSKVDAKGVIKCAVGSEDGSVYVYEMTAPTYNFLGSFAVDSSLSVPFGLDFSKAGRYMRVFYGPLKKAKYFIFQKEEEVAGGAAVAVEVAKPEWVVSNIVFASVSFPTAPEAKSVLQMSAGRAPVSMSTCPVTPSSDVSMMAVTYSDGHIGLVKGPYVAPNATMADGADLQTGPTFGVFAKQSVPESAVLCTYGGDDGSILIWDAVAP
jgi:WD40 repeat protein